MDEKGEDDEAYSALNKLLQTSSAIHINPAEGADVLRRRSCNLKLPQIKIV